MLQFPTGRQPPRYELLTCDGPGEARKAAQVAARLAGLGALRGDRRAGSVADLSGFEMHNHPLAGEALASLLRELKQFESSADPTERAMQREVARLDMFGDRKAPMTVTRFLNRLMGLPLAMQDARHAS